MNQEPPKIEFPCDYPIKIMGDAADDFQALVVGIMQKYDPKLDLKRVQSRDSRNGKFVSITVYIEATGVEQLQAIHTELQATGRVRMVL